MIQIHSALAYYWEHKEALDAEIVRRSTHVTKLREEAGDSPVAKRLRDKGHLG